MELETFLTFHAFFMLDSIRVGGVSCLPFPESNSKGICVEGLSEGHFNFS